MLILLFILLITASIFIYYHFSNKIYNQRKQLLLLKYQNSNLKCKTKIDKPVLTTIRYMTPKSKEGKIIESCKLHISPFLESPTINSLKENTLVLIQDSAEIDHEIWYEVSILTENRTNSKGWLKFQYVQLSSENNQ